MQDAHQYCLAILKLDQTFADAWFLCGVIAAHNGQIDKAVKIFHRAISLAPDNPEYLAELGKQQIALHQTQQALLTARKAADLSPTELTTLNTLGTVFSHCGEHEGALACYERAIESLQCKATGAISLPITWQAELYLNTAASRQFAGQFDAAEQAYEKAISLQPQFYKAHYALSLLRSQSQQRHHLTRLLSLLPTVTTPEDQLRLGHAIAKEQEDLEQYSASLASLAWAKQAQAKAVNYRTKTDEVLFDNIVQGFAPALLSKPLPACDNPEAIFIVGMPRTGTTLVEQILSSHSQVFAAGELQNFPLQVKRMTGSPSVDVMDSETFNRSTGLDMAALGAAYINSTRPRTGKLPYFIDKLPLNFMYLGLIHLALPKAKLICLRRDPMDTCLSNYRQLFAANFKHYDYSYDLLDCGRYYIQFDRLMRHWREAMPGVVFEVHYEALVENPEKVARKLLEHCELPWEDQCLSFHQRKTSVATASAVQVRQEIYTSSVKRWRRYGDAMQPLFTLLQSAGFYS